MKAKLITDTYFGKVGDVFELNEIEEYETFTLWNVRPEGSHNSKKLHLSETEFKGFFKVIKK